jgi:uncharacterized protein
MIYFYDTSALAKLYVDEAFSELLRKNAAQATVTIVCELTWVEMCAALGRRMKTGETTPADAQAAMMKLGANWPSYRQVHIAPVLLQLAGQYAQTLGLRAYDSVQLACAKSTHTAVGGNMTFCCFDKALNNAAKALGMRVLEL